MKLCVSYFDHSISFEKEKISVLEMENKGYFYSIIHDLIAIEEGVLVDSVIFFKEEAVEWEHPNIKVIINYFDTSFDSTKINNYIIKQIVNDINGTDRENLNKNFHKICKNVYDIIGRFDIPLTFSDELNIEALIKHLKIKVANRKNLMDSLILLIDISKILENMDLLVFVNLKQYLTKDELLELYKYAIYNEITILLVDSQCYGVGLKYEEKLIIDSNMDEFML